MAQEVHSIRVDNHGNGRMTVHDWWRGTTEIAEEDLRPFLQLYNDERFQISITHAGPPLPGSRYPADVHVEISRWAPDPR